MLTEPDKTYFKEFLKDILDDDYGIPASACATLFFVLDFLPFEERQNIIGQIKNVDDRLVLRKVDK